MMIKKRFSFRSIAILLICVFVSSCIPAFSAEEAAADYSKEIDMLKLFDVAAATVDEDSFTPDTVVTRGEFAQYMAKLLNAQGTNNGQLYYHDVPKTHYAYDEITVLTQMGLMSGVGNKMFAPKEDMMTEYVFGVLLKAIGFGSVAASYSEAEKMNICMRQGILDGVSKVSGPLTLGDLYRMLYNTLFAECFAQQLDGVTATDKIFLEVTRRVKYVRSGRVTRVDGMDINDGKLDDDIVVIGGIKLEEPDFDMNEYLGKTVRFIYDETLKGNITVGKLIWLQAVSSDDTLELEVTPKCSYNKTTGELTYPVDGGKYKTVDIPENVTMIYNGRYRKSGIKDVFAGDRYDLTLVKNDANQYNLAIVWEYTNIVAKKLGALDKIVYGMETSDKLNLDPDDYEKLEIIGADGAAIDFSGIVLGDVLSAYTTEDGDYCKVYVTKNPVSGKVNQVKKETIQVGEQWYEFFADGVNPSPYLGKEVTLFLDLKGFITGVEESLSSSMNVGYLIAGAVDTQAFDATLKFRILKTDGTVGIFDAAESFYINETSYKGNIAGAEAFLSDGGTAVKPQLIVYQPDAQGRIRKMYTALEDGHGIDSHPLTINARIEPTEWQTSTYGYYTAGRIGSLMAVGSTTKLFMVPDDSLATSAEDKYFRVGLSNISSGDYSSYDIVSYRTTQDKPFFEEIIVIKNNSLSDQESTAAVMIDHVEEKINTDGDVVKLVYVYNSAASLVSFELDPDFDYDAKGYSRGDVVKYYRNAMTGLITGMNTIYQPSKDIAIAPTKNNLTDTYRSFVGYVNATYPEGIKVGYENGSEVNEVLNMASTGTSKVAIYDTEKDEIFVGTTADLKDFDTYGRNCSPVVVGTHEARFSYLFGHR